MLHRLKTSGWKKPNSVDITFTPGMNAIVGPNYTGKSSLLSAILFALGGASVVAGSRLETTGSTGKFSVELWFLKYYVIRTKSKAELYEVGETGVIGEPIAVGTSVVNRRIALILGMPVKRFMDLKVARQKKTDKILSLGGTELFKIIQDLTGISEVEKVIEKVAGRSKITEGTLEALPFSAEQLAQAEAVMPVLTVQLEKTSEALEKAKNAFQKASGRVATLRETLETSTEEWSNFKTKSQLRQQNQRNLNDLLDRKAMLKDEQVVCLAALPQNSDAELEGAQRFLDWLQDLRNKKVSQERDLNQKKNRQKDKQEKVDGLRTQLAQVEWSFAEREPYDAQAYEANSKKIVDTLGSIAVLRNKVKTLKTTLEDGVCPECKRPYDDAEEHLEKAKAELEEAQQKLAEAQETLDALQVTKETLEATRDLQVRVANARASLEEHEVELASLKAETAAAQASLDAILEDLTRDTPREEGFTLKVKTLSEAKENLKRANLRLAEVERQEQPLRDALEATPVVATPVILTPEELRPMLTEALQEETEHRGVERELTRQLAADESRLQLVTSNVELLRESRARREALEVRQGVELALLKYLRTSRDRFTQDLWSQFLIRASQFVRECTDGRVTDLDRDEKGEFRYMEAGHWYSLDEASGCQLNLMGLAVQMALADVASCPLNVLLADEPTDSMEDEHSLAAMMALSTCGKQVICVTHKDLDRSLFSNVIELERK